MCSKNLRIKLRYGMMINQKISILKILQAIDVTMLKEKKNMKTNMYAYI